MLSGAARAAQTPGRAARGLGGLVGHSLRRPAQLGRDARRPGAPGAAPGIETIPEIHTPPEPEAVRVGALDYGAGAVHDVDVTDLDRFLDAPRPAGTTVRWLDVESLSPWVVHRLHRHFGFHTLTAEDVLHVPQRPKLEMHTDHVFVAAQMLTIEDGHLAREQVSFFLYQDTLITVGERPGDVFDPVRSRIHADGSRVRELGADYLLYALLDSLVDHWFVVLEHYGDRLNELEECLLEGPTPELLRQLHGVKRELALVRRIVWPTREVVGALGRNEQGRLSDVTLTYLRDVNDHATQVMDILETYRELAAGLTDLYLSSTSHRLNEIMKVLTVLSALFVPITFLAGVYGMNFERMPELGWGWAYPLGFWVICGVVVVALLVFFWYRGWLGGRSRR